MSDLITTPSQTQSTVSSEAFEALIDLLASDGIDDGLGGSHTPPQANATLRDPSGKLDFDKIRLMFAAQNGCRRISVGQEKDRTPSPTAPDEDGDSDDEHRSHPSSAVPSRPQSTSPKPVERPSAGHKRSSTFGNQPWAPMHENAAKVEDVAPTLSHQPLSFHELNTALTGAHEEVRSLRQQYDELRALVAKRWGTELRGQDNSRASAVIAETVAPEVHNGHGVTATAGSQAQPGDILPPILAPLDVPTEIADLSEKEAKRALAALACSLNLSLDAIGALASPSTLMPQQSSFPLNSSRQHEVASIARALKFLGTIDELVWRRTSAPSGPRMLLPVFSEENIAALVARLELWERAVRRSSRI